MRSYRINIDGHSFLVEIEERPDGRLDVRVDGQPFEAEIEWVGDSPRATVTPDIVPKSLQEVPLASRVPPTGMQTSSQIDEDEEEIASVMAPMPGTILDVAVQPGDWVDVGQNLLVLEAMKMKNTIRSPRAGRVSQVHVRPGQRVAFGDPLVSFEGSPETD
ncbi:MAG: acetyl-CoA carboxylase biotin carboxyl carrier protein subunit [Anaerolineae bacterium]